MACLVHLRSGGERKSIATWQSNLHRLFKQSFSALRQAVLLDLEVLAPSTDQKSYLEV